MSNERTKVNNTIYPGAEDAPQPSEIEVQVSDPGRGHMQIHVSELGPKREGLLATAHHPGGGPAFTLTEKTLVQYGPHTMTLRQAEFAGLVRRLGETWEEIPQGERDAKVAKQLEEREDPNKSSAFPEALPAEADQRLTDAHAALLAVHENPDAAVLEFLSRPQNFQGRVLPKLAKHSGATAERIMEDIQATFNECKAQLMGLAKSHGIEGERYDEFTEWLDSRPAYEQNAAILQQLKGVSIGWRRLLARFTEARPLPAKVTQLPPGVTAGKTSDGREYVLLTDPKTGKKIACSVQVAKANGWI